MVTHDDFGDIELMSEDQVTSQSERADDEVQVIEIASDSEGSHIILHYSITTLCF